MARGVIGPSDPCGSTIRRSIPAAPAHFGLRILDLRLPPATLAALLPTAPACPRLPRCATAHAGPQPQVFSLQPWAKPCRTQCPAAEGSEAVPPLPTSDFGARSSGREPVQVAREERGLADVRRPDQPGQPALQPDGEAAVRRHAVPERLQVAGQRRRI